MNISTQGRRARYFALFTAAFFFLSGVFFVPHLGVQNDEALFASPMFAPKDWFYRIRIFHSDIALLLMSYLGTLKTLLYKPVFRWFGVSAASTRIPMLLAGAASIWLFFLLLRRLVGERAACIGCALLAADSLFLLTTCFDWGPVALQHLLIITGLLLAVRFYQERRPLSLFGAFLLFGLAVWDKALALWMLSGMGIAAMAIVPRQILGAVNFRRTGIAIGGFLLGASPFLIYNLTHRFATLRENSARDFSDIEGRARLLQNTADGQAMFGWLIEENQDTPVPHPPSDAVESLSADISSFTGHPRHSLMVYGFLLALLLAPLARGPDLRVILFGLVALTLAWIQMATTANAGGSVHHSILLWPLPAMVIAVSLAAASRRLGRAGLPAALALTAILAGSEVLVTNEYYALMVRNGGTVPWSDAVYTLSDYLKSTSGPAARLSGGVPAKQVACVDWGILDTLRLLNRGTLPLRWGGDEDDPRLPELIAQPGTLFLGHTAGREIFPGKTEKLTQRAAALGYKRKVLAVIGDSFGRPTFEVFRFEP